MMTITVPDGYMTGDADVNPGPERSLGYFQPLEYPPIIFFNFDDAAFFVSMR